MFTDKQSIEEALQRTARRLALMHANDYALLVCGGSALNVLGLLQRPTRDVDVLGVIKSQPASHGAKQIVTKQTLPQELLSAAHAVASELGLPEDWLNDSASDVQRLSLPPRILRRAHRQEYGLCLTVFFIGRADQVALKLYAALDRQSGRRHLQDLVALEPTRQEMQFAVRWLLDRPTSVQFRKAVRQLASGFGPLRGIGQPRAKLQTPKQGPRQRRKRRTPQ